MSAGGLSFALDSYAPGARFLNVTASARGGRLLLSGAYRSPAGLLPVLLFSAGVPWLEEEARAPTACWLRGLARRYRDPGLEAAAGAACEGGRSLMSGGVDLLKGNAPPPADSGGDATWTVNTTAHPSFVAMLFVGAAETVYRQVLPLRWTEASTVRWQSSWQGRPCHTVVYPNGQPVCIACFNTKPDNAVFVFSANWFTTFQCRWVCKPGFAGPGCEVEVDLAVYVLGTLTAALLVAGLVVGALERRRLVVADDNKKDDAAHKAV
jgi:hypothetical protein